MDTTQSCLETFTVGDKVTLIDNDSAELTGLTFGEIYTIACIAELPQEEGYPPQGLLFDKAHDHVFIGDKNLADPEGKGRWVLGSLFFKKKVL